MTPPEDRRALGRWGEQQAAEYLRRKGWRIVCMNYAGRFGEIDIIARDRRYLIFVEVKLRKNADFAQAREFVTSAKQRRIGLTARLWLASHPTELQPRFDVVEVYAAQGQVQQINHIENAFTVEG